MLYYIYNIEKAIIMKIKRIVLTSLMAGLIAICSWLTIPSVVPFTMQTFAIFCALLLLGGLDGTIAILVYVVLGMIGVPVFSGFRGGVAHILGPTGGYIVGFVATGLIYLLMELVFSKFNGKKRIAFEIISLFIGLLACYTIGTIWFYVVNSTSGYNFWKILMLCVIPYIIPDLIKLILAVMLCTKLKKIIIKEEWENE